MLRSRDVFALVFAATVGAVLPNLALAEVTPSEVCQVLDHINRELEAILAAAGRTPPTDPGAPAVAERRSRHVLQEAREVLQRIGDIHGHHGLPEVDVPDFPLHEVTSSEMEVFADAVLEAIRELRPVFGATETPAPAPLPSGKTPPDVFALLHEVGLGIDALGETKVEPRHVYRTALIMAHQLDDIRDQIGQAVAIKVAVGSSTTVEFAMPKRADQVPTNLYDAIGLSRALVDGLERSS